MSFNLSSSSAQAAPIDLIKAFWDAPLSAFFSQKTIALVRNVSEKKLEADRWKGVGIPYRKVSGHVLYQKADVVTFLESHELVRSTSQYKGERCTQ